MSSDMGDAFREDRERKQKAVREGKRASMQYATEKDREWGSESKQRALDSDDRHEMSRLKRLDLHPVHKGPHSFQILLLGRTGMYYTGKKIHIRFNDGEVIDFLYHDDITKYVRRARGKV